MTEKRNRIIRQQTLLAYLFQDQGTVKGVNDDTFKPLESVKALRKAFRGLGTDEKVIIDFLTSHTNLQRQEVALLYKQQYHRDLLSDMEDELGGHFLDSCLSLLYTPHLFDAHSLRKAMKGTATDESVLIEILCSRPSSDLEGIKQAYGEEFDRDLEGDLIAETADNRILIQTLVSGSRESNLEPDMLTAEKDVVKLINACKTGDIYVVIDALCLRSAAQLKATFEVYKKRTGRDLEQDIRKQFPDGVKDGFLALIKIMKSVPGYFCERIHDCLKGSGTNDETLIRIIVSRSEIDLQLIKDEYLKKYKVTLAKSVKDDCSGDYCRLLQKLIGN